MKRVLKLKNDINEISEDVISKKVSKVKEGVIRVD
jgi:hypothetical protein